LAVTAVSPAKISSSNVFAATPYLHFDRDALGAHFVVTHRAKLADAPRMYEKFLNKEDECIKVVLTP